MTDADVPEGLDPRDLADWLLARGRHWISTSEVADLLGIPERHVAPSLAELRKRGHLFSPTKGWYVAIPPEFRSWGAVPASHFIDPMMRRLEHGYYVGLLSAAEIHGFAHQRPQVFQVVTPARLRDRTFGRVRIEFITSRRASDRPVVDVNTPTGTMSVSTPETTVLDLVSFPNESGSLFNVATIVGDMLEEDALGMDRLAQVAAHYPVSIVQRTGWLLDFMAEQLELDVDTEPLTPLAASRATPTPLDPFYGRSGHRDTRWNVLVVEYPDEESS